MKIEDLMDKRLRDILGAPCTFKDPFTRRTRKGNLISIAVGRVIVRGKDKIGRNLVWDDVVSVIPFD